MTVKNGDISGTVIGSYNDFAIQTESDSIENEVKEQVFENMENESHSLNQNYIIFAIIVGIFAMGIILKVQQKSIEVKTDWEANGKGKILEESGVNYEKEEQPF